MNLEKNSRYLDNLHTVASLPLNWEAFRGKSVLISGATGMIGSFLVDVLMLHNRVNALNCRVVTLGRSPEKAHSRFSAYGKDPNFSFVCCDINREDIPQMDQVDYIFHLASNTHPVAYATDPIGTITANIIGTNKLLEYGAQHCAKRFVFASSVEIYGENRGDQELFSEDYCGYIDCNTLRAGYPESKRAGEALCQAYISQRKMDVVIARLSRTYGPTMLMSDTKALSQFIKKGLAGENIVLKSDGSQFYSYSYVADTVSGLLYCLCFGKCGEAYNIADEASNITLRELAQTIATLTGQNVIFELPDEVERSGYSKATKAAMNARKIQGLGWKALWNIPEGLDDTLEILRADAL